MGFWQGLNEGFTYVMEQKTRKQEREEEIALRKAEKEEQRAYEREMFMMQTAEARRDNLLGLFAQREQKKAEAAALTGQAQSFFSRLEGAEGDPRVEALMASPEVAAELEAKVREIEVERAKSDLDLPPLRGEVLLDLLTIKAPDGSVRPVDYSLDELLEMDMSDRGSYESMILDLSRPTPKPYVEVDPSAYRKMDPKVLEEGRKAFDQEVIRQARAYQQTVGESAADFAEVEALLADYNTEGSAARIALQDMFGMQAFSSLAQSGNPYIQNLEQDPQLSRYSTMTQLNNIINDPEASPEEKARAEQLLLRLQGR